MRSSTLALAVGLAQLALSHPLEKRQNALPTAKSTTDESVLQLANYLENLEHELYTEGYERFTDAEYTAAGFPPGFRENVGVIAQVRYFVAENLVDNQLSPEVIARSYTHPDHRYHLDRFWLHGRTTMHRKHYPHK